MKNLKLLLVIFLFVSCSKNENSITVEPEKDEIISQSEEIHKETRKLSSFIDKYVKSSNLVKSVQAPLPPVKEALTAYYKTQLTPLQAQVVDKYILEVSPHFQEFANSNEKLPLLTEATSEITATALLKK